MQDEICGPIIAFCKACDMDHLLEMANNTEYGLTGSFFSNNRKHIERAREEFQVGNLYINRNGTRAIVGKQSLGGFHMSNTDSKAGGLDDLLLYTQVKTISERL